MLSLRGPVLVVEDDEDIRESMVAVLELHGIPVRAAAHGREALTLLTAHPRPSLVLLDMAMPVMDGHRLLTARAGNEALRQVPVVVISAGMAVKAPRDLARYGASLNVAAFIKKPADPRAVLEAIERHALRDASGAEAGAPA